MRQSIDEQRIGALYTAGHSIRGVARECGYSPKTVHRHLVAAGVALRPASAPRARRPDPQAEFTAGQVTDIMDCYQRGGVSLHELGARYEVSDGIIARLLRRNGVILRPAGRTHAAAAAAAACVAGTRRLHAKGHSARQIAQLLGRDLSTVYAAHVQAGLTPNRARRRVTAWQAQQFSSMAAAGRSTAQIAQATGWSPSTVRGHLTRSGRSQPSRAA